MLVKCTTIFNVKCNVQIFLDFLSPACFLHLPSTHLKVETDVKTHHFVCSPLRFFRR